MGVEQIIKEVAGELERIVSTKTVVGESVTAAGKTIIPVTKVTFGFGSGGGEGTENGGKGGSGGGGGAGAKIEPVAFIVISEEDVRLLTVSGKTDFGKIIDAVPELIDNIKSIKGKMSKKEKKNESEVSEEEEGCID
ncbi:MAG: sporulation protein [Methanosarcinaceae archaeon]|nr:sporulation protein [Methanosarcinaceae archaeon]